MATPFITGGKPWQGTWAVSLRAWALVVVPFALLAPAQFNAAGAPMEEGSLLVAAQRIRHGELANQDFQHLYGPASLDVLAAWTAAFGDTLGAERTLGMVQQFGIVAAIWMIARPCGRAMAVALASISMVTGSLAMGFSALAWPGASALGLFAVVFTARAATTGNRTDWLAAGALAGLCLAYRPDLVLAIALGCLPVWWRHRALWRLTAAGMALGATPMWVHLARVGPRTAVEGMLLDPVVNLRGGRSLPNPPSRDSLDSALQRLVEVEPPPWPFPALSAPHQHLIAWAGIVVTCVALVLFLGVFRDQPRLWAPTGFAIGLAPQAFQRPDSTHLAFVACIMIPVALLCLIVRLSERGDQSVVAGWAPVIATALISVVILPFHTVRGTVDRLTDWNDDGVAAVRRGPRQFPVGVATTAAYQGAVDTLDRLAEPGDTLLVGPSDLSIAAYNDTFIYWLFPDLEPASRFLAVEPGLSNTEHSGWATSVAAADWVLLSDTWSWWSEPNTSATPGDAGANAALAEHHCFVADFGEGLVALFKNCPGPEGVDALGRPAAPGG